MKPSNRNDGWILGRIYFNREDKRVIVKRLHGGYSMNFGNKWTQPKLNNPPPTQQHT